MERPGEVTALLIDWHQGDSKALELLMPIVLDELRSLARGLLHNERPGHTLQPTALVNEAYLRLIGQTRMPWQCRSQFYGIAASMMRRILIDHARQHRAQKRGGDFDKLPLDEALGVAELGQLDPRELDLLALDQALKSLFKLDPRAAKVVELRFFGGLSVERTAAVLDISKTTVKREWQTAKAWLYRRLKKSQAAD